MADCAVDNIVLVAPESIRCFIMRSSQPFTITGNSEVCLECENEQVRDLWIAFFSDIVGKRVRVIILVLCVFGSKTTWACDLRPRVGMSLQKVYEDD